MAGKLSGHDWDGKAWLSDEALSRCGDTARAMWADMVSWMMLSPQKGRLVGTDGAPWSDEDIVAACRGDKPALRDALRELLTKGVCSRDTQDQGVAIYCRRIVRRERDKRASADRVSRFRTRKRTGDVTPNVTPGVTGGGIIGGSTPFLDSLLNSREDIPFKTKAFETALNDWLVYKKERRESYKPKGFAALLKKLSDMGEQGAIAAIRNSMSSNYAGVFEPRGHGVTSRTSGSGAGQSYDPAAKEREPDLGKF